MIMIIFVKYSDNVKIYKLFVEGIEIQPEEEEEFNEIEEIEEPISQ